TAIQAAIDYAFAHFFRTVFLPAGTYKTTASLYLDPPDNLRVNFSNPPRANFSMSLVGAEGLGDHEGYATQIKPTSNSFTCLYVGTGQGMMVKNITINARSTAYRGNQPSAIGIGLCGGGGGSSRTRIENCQVENYFYGYQTDANNHDMLCDS